MGRELPPSAYDERLERVMLPYEESPWRPIYDAVVSDLPAERDVAIVDVGCGTGRCAEAIRRAGYTSYVGIDFSPRRIEEARRYVPQFEFVVADVFSDDARALIRNGSAFVVTEALEHVERDLELLRSIPAGALVLFSVPNFDSAGHVRTFESVNAVRERYGSLLRIDGEYTIPKPTRRHKMTFVCRAVRAA